MKKQFSHLQHIENHGPIEKETHADFLFHLQGALLLALKERGTLTDSQYRYAQEHLQQLRYRAKVSSERNVP